MKKTTLTLLSVCFLLSTQVSFAQEKKQPAKRPAATTAKPAVKKAPKKEPTPEEMQKTWMDYATPGEVHKMIAQSDGEWQGTVTHWMAPGADGMESKCTANNKMVMGGRYQITDFKGEFMGMPFEGMGTLAYDNTKKVFITTWIDNMGTGLMTMQGTWDDKTKSITFRGKMVDPSVGDYVDVKEVFTIKDEKTQTIEMFSPLPDGKGEFKTMQVVLKR